ncbi:TonB-dependent receptor [Bacteroidia bacterium]|nr:TonB-dependent receptor [Bacteroidia bacterium]GHT62820.1 TonB-dependent receptor [Bacteroidia bacterium]
MKKTILVFIFANIALASAAQIFQLSGKVLEDNNNPVEFAEILLVQNDSVFQYELTDENGNFLMNAVQGIYTLYVKQLGDTLYRQSININHIIDLNITTTIKAKELQEVTITAQKKLIERKADRLVFNVSNLPSTDGGDVMEILKVTPGLTINNNIAIIGKGSVDVLINDRPIQLSGDELINFLKGLRANDVQSIEVITTPPAKYDAEGNSGLINIVMKKISQNTWSSSVFNNYTQTKYAAESFGGNFNYRKNKLSFFANASYSSGKSNNDDETTIFYPELKWESKGNYIYRLNSINTRTGFDVNLTDNWTLGAQYMGSFSKPKSTSGDRTAISDRFDDADRGNVITEGKSNSKSNTQSANVHSIVTLDTLGRKINFDFDILNYHSNSNKTYASNTTSSQDVEIPNGFVSQNNLLNRKITNYSTQIDVEHPIEKFSLNYGVKLSFTNTNNDINVFDLSSGVPTNDLNQSNKFLYKENMQAVYFSGSTFFGENKQWEAQVGLRGENTQFKGNSVTMDTVFKKSYFELFPTAYLGYNMNEKNIFYAEYGRRISRPGFDQLNPFRSYSSPYYYFAGNPELKPSFSDNFQLGYIYNNVFQVAASFSKDKDNSGGGIVLIDNDNYTQVGTRLNYFDNYSTGINAAYVFNKWSWWMTQNAANFYFSHADSKIYPLTPKTMEGYGASFMTYHIFYLNQSQTLSAGFDFTYSPSQASSDLTYSYSRTNLNAFVKMLFMDRKLSVTLTGSNLLKEYSFNHKSERNGLLMYSKGNYNPTFVRLSVSYSFGSNNVKVRQWEVSNQDEKNRVN